MYDFLLVINSNLGPITHRYWVRYSDLLAKNRKFFLPSSHLALSFGVTLSEFMEKLYGPETRVFQAADGTVFDWSTSVTDGRTTGQTDGQTKLRWLSRAKAV